MKKLCILALALASFPALADNNHGFYAGAGFASIKDYQDGVDDLSRIKAAEIFGGYKYNDALGVELRIGSGQSTGTSKFFFDAQGNLQTGGSLEREIGSYQSIYYKPELVNDEAKLYVLLGYSHVSSTGTTTSSTGTVTKLDSSGSGFSYGLGVGFVVNEHFNINLEYRNISEDISNKPNIASINVDYRF